MTDTNEYVFEIIPAIYHNKPDIVRLYRITDDRDVTLIDEKKFLVNSPYTSVGEVGMEKYLRHLKSVGAVEVNEYIIKNNL